MQEYPRFKKGEIQEVRNKFPSKTKKELSEFENYCRIGAGERKVGDMARSVTAFIVVTGGKFTLETLRIFLALLNRSDKTEYAKNGVKIHVRKFLKWKFKDWSERFDNFSDIRLTQGHNEKKINASVLVSKEDIENMIKAENSLYWKTLILVLYETGARPSEIANLKWSDIKIESDGELSELHIYASKTGKSRVVYVKEATRYLKKLKESQE